MLCKRGRLTVTVAARGEMMYSRFHEDSNRKNNKYNYQRGEIVKKFGVLIIVLMFSFGVAGTTKAQVLYHYRLETNQIVELFQLKTCVLSPVVRSSDIQHIFLTVRDQNLDPIAGAASMLTVHFPDGVQSLLLPLTDENGVSRFELEVNNQPPGRRVILEFRVVYGELQTTTQDSFRIWW